MKIVETKSYPVSIFIAGSAMEAETICLDYCDAVGRADRGRRGMVYLLHG